ncbi:MAG: hypothetical protein ABFD13_00805 [Candidatus Cryosericum sp.]|nr:hypothetical protein [bacterium]
MREDRQGNTWTIEDVEQPLELSADARRHLMAILAPMDRSVASAVMTAVRNERLHRRRLQGLWLGLMPVAAAVVVMMLYVSGTVLRPLSMQTTGSALSAPAVAADFADAAPKGMLQSENLSGAMCQPHSVRVLLSGDALKKQLLATWLRTRHPQAALELERVAPGDIVTVTLDVDEVPGFADFMVLHGFTGAAASGLRTIAACSSASWSSLIDSSALTICVIP